MLEMKREENLLVRFFTICSQTFRLKYFKNIFIALQEYSVLLVSFHLQRHMGNFLIQVYGPCIRKKIKSFRKGKNNFFYFFFSACGFVVGKLLAEQRGYC
jgi:hypothetical protein